MVKHIADINNYIVSIDSDGILNTPGINPGIIKDTNNSTGSSGDSVVADGAGGWSWTQSSGGVTGQPVSNSDSPSFTQLTLGNTGVNQGILNLQDGTNTIAQIKSIKEGNNGGEIQIFTKADQGSLTERMTIQQNGLVSIKTAGVALKIASQDGTTEQSYIYNNPSGTKDFIMDAGVGSSASKSIAFKTSGIDRLKIGSNGEIGIGGANYGNPGQVIVSNGTGNAVSWANQTDTNTTYSAGVGLTLSGTTFNNVYNSFYSGPRLYTVGNGAVGQYGVHRSDFTNGDSLGFHGSNHGISYLEMMYTHPGLQIGSVINGNWRGSQILSLNGSNSAWQIYTFGSGVTRLVPYSDDRVKTHEQTFSGETYINYVKQIIPKKYKKYGVILTKEEEELLEAGGDPFKDKRTGDPIKDSPFDPQIEYGVIAQDIHKISGLEDIVKVGNDDTKWSVDYRSIDTITLGAVKGLIDKIEKLEERIKVLEGK